MTFVLPGAQSSNVCALWSTIQQRLVVLPKAQSSAVLVIMCSRRASTCSASSLSQVCWLRCRPAPLPLQIAHVELLARVMCNGLPSLSPCPTPGRTRCLKNCLQDPGRHAHGESRWYSSSSMHVYRGPWVFHCIHWCVCVYYWKGLQTFQGGTTNVLWKRRSVSKGA